MDLSAAYECKIMIFYLFIFFWQCDTDPIALEHIQLIKPPLIHLPLGSNGISDNHKQNIKTSRSVVFTWGGGLQQSLKANMSSDSKTTNGAWQSGPGPMWVPCARIILIK